MDPHTDVEPGHRGGHQVSGYRTDVSNQFYNQLPPSDTIHKCTLAPEVGRFHIGALTDMEPVPWGGYQESGHGPAMVPMFQIMIYNQLPTSNAIHKWNLVPEVGWFHIGVLTDVEPGHRGGHQVIGHGTNVSNQFL